MSQQKVVNNKLSINFIATTIQMIINYGISFGLTPFLVENVGSEAYGFVGLSNNMVNYVSIITIALNSVAGRFITICIHRGEKKDANEYFNSVIGANCLLAIVVCIIFFPIIIFIDAIFDIPLKLIGDVRLLFLFIVLNYIVTIVSNVFTVATFITNDLYLTNIGNSIGAILRVGLLVALFGILPTKVAYVGMTSLASTIFISIYNYFITKKSNVGLVVDLKNFKFDKIKVLFISGIWSSVTKLSQVLADGLDLLISNLFLSSSVMGALSVAYTIPTLIGTTIGTISSIFSPQQTYYFAKDNISGVVKQLTLNMKMMGFFASIIISGFIVYGMEFFEIWTPTQDINLIYNLAIISSISIIVSGVTTALNNVFLITNHLKENSLVILGTSFFDIFMMFLLLKFTSLGVFAVAGVSKVVGLFLNLTYVPMYSAYCLGVSKKTFYPVIVRYISCIIIILIEMIFIRHIMSTTHTNFVIFICKCLISGLMGIITNFFLLLNNEEKSYFMLRVKSKL